VSTTSVLRTEYHPSTVRCLAIPSEYKILGASPRAVPSAVLARSPPLFIFVMGYVIVRAAWRLLVARLHFSVRRV